MTRIAVVFLALFLITSVAAAQTIDKGTGRAPAAAASGLSDLASRVDVIYTIGYTTNSVVQHYGDLDDASRTTARTDLVAQGHTLVPINSLDPGDLAGLDGLIIGVVSHLDQLSAAQMDVVEDFVLAGGNLYFIGENNSHFRDNNVVVGGRFGIEYPAVDPSEVILDLVSAHPAIQGPYGPVALVDGSNNNPTFYGSMSSPGPYGLSILDFPGGNSACVIIEAGLLAPTAGFVIAVAEVNVWDNDQIDVADNRVYWNNLFAYAPGTVAVEPMSWSGVKSLFD